MPDKIYFKFLTLRRSTQHLFEFYLQESQELKSFARVPQPDHPIVPVRRNSLAKFLAGSRVIIRNASPDAHRNTPSNRKRRLLLRVLSMDSSRSIHN